ncbi:hypothetical protein ACFLV6_00240 [Chloroflexota bacterium]
MSNREGRDSHASKIGHARDVASHYSLSLKARGGDGGNTASNASRIGTGTVMWIGKHGIWY